MNVIPCDKHHAILHPSFPWHRALEVAAECPRCMMSEEEL